MAEFKISRIRYTWKGNWTTSTAYIKDDIVRYGGSAYVCIRQHTASTFNADQEYYASPGDTSFSPAWEVMAEGYAWRGSWQTTTLYNYGDLALYGGVVYLCVDSHTSAAQFITNNSKWTTYASQYNWSAGWEPVPRHYGVGEIVKYGGIVYICNTEHTSGSASSGLEADQAHWDVFYEGIDYKGVWQSSIRYKANDLVKYGGSVLRCVVGHTSGPYITNANFITEFPGHNFYDAWTSANYYAVGDVVRHGGQLYRANANNNASNPSDSVYQATSSNWSVLSKAINYQGDWSSSSSYKTGDLVRRGGHLYVALLDTTADGSSQDSLDSGNWELVVPSQNWRDAWHEDIEYSVGDVISYEGNAYVCTVQHLASIDPPNWPGDNGEGYDYWDLLLQAGPNVGLKKRGDLLTYDLSRSNLGDGSTFGPTSVPIGQEDHYLSIRNENYQDGTQLFYRQWGNLVRVYYISPNGLDDDTDADRGLNPFKPFRTLRFACETIENLNIAAPTTSIVHVLPGRYEEIGPIIVPARTSIKGDELRASTIVASPPIAALENDVTYTVEILGRFQELMDNVLTGVEVTVTSGNSVDQVIPNNGDESSLLVGVDARNLLQNMIDYIEFRAGDGEVDPTMTGTNTASTDTDYVNAVAILEANKEFFAAEAVAFMEFYYPNYNFDSNSCKRDARRYIDAIKYDLIYTGNYKSIYAARYYVNAVLGSELEDMFYVRDAATIRNLTLEGLSGTLNPPQVFDLYRRPTGKSYVSLDPGWGPADNRTWITSRSPYIQNVTTKGTACIGQKIDGSLHNGGNKSIVSNDFTQVLSDGIGAWVLNNGRAELVSVFTYYCQVGYLAENGGRIRATNGNNSYGSYGAISQGVDATETPAEANVNNRNNDPSVLQAFAGEVNDEILIFEFEHCGQNYTQASYTITGSGTGAAVIQEDFRDGGVFQSRVIDPVDSFVIGGAGYKLVGNNAQSGNTTSITIASNDSGSEAEYLGLRIILTSGTGTGQYGVITAYNTGTKVVSVQRESDGIAGWDHVIPGYPIAASLGTATQYRIEPRVVFDEPPYAARPVTLSILTTWANATYGETTETYTSITGTAGTGETINIVPASAVFTVNKVGRTYTVTQTYGGAGYEVGQTVTLSGDDLGGTTPDNDVTITVTSVSEDSTNSIVTFTYEGLAASGKFVVTPNTGTSGICSPDGENDWNDSTLPSSGNWKALAGGNNRFVAIRFNSAVAAYSLNGETWTTTSMPASRNWNSVVWGNPNNNGGVFVAVSGNNNSAAKSTDGITWTSVTMPTVGDSSINEWVDITFGKNVFVAIANSGNVSAKGTYNAITGIISWTGYIMDVVADSSAKDWISVAYGNNRFVALSATGNIAYSFDGQEWYGATMPKPDGSTIMRWNKMKYGNGVFVALCDSAGQAVGADGFGQNEVAFIYSSPDGVTWTLRETDIAGEWAVLAFGNPDVAVNDSTIIDLRNNSPRFLVVEGGSTGTATALAVEVGARAQGRAVVATGQVAGLKIWDPGSNYSLLSPPSVTLIDPNNTTEVVLDNRVGNGVLGQPSWLNRGLGYRTSTTDVTVTGDGFADRFPVGKFVTLSNLSSYPGPGAQILFDGNSQIYTVVTIQPLGQDLGGTGLSAYFRVSPTIELFNAPVHNEHCIIRERYSQCRITGHDFLDIGTGNFEETNYPEVYTSGQDYLTAPEDEIVEGSGGRVFYTSTDQSGNFRAGELFSVEQATGIVTISADFFDLNGLSELRLGGIRIGGSGVVIREFSTDPSFTENSNNVIPTQRAIKSYLNNRLTVGGSEIATSSFIAGVVKVGPNEIRTTTGAGLVIPVKANFEGSTTLISGSILAQSMFYKARFPR